MKRTGPHRRLAIGVVILKAGRDDIERTVISGSTYGELWLAAIAGVREHLGHPGELPGADDDVDVRGPPKDRFLVFLRHATQHADLQLRLALLESLDSAQRAIDLVLGMLAHRTGIVEDGIGLVEVVGQLVSLGPQFGHDQLAVEQVHLAADRLDVELLPRRRGR